MVQVVLVMYQGRVLETGPVRRVLEVLVPPAYAFIRRTTLLHRVSRIFTYPDTGPQYQ